MIDKTRLEKLATLAVKIGANVQEGQHVFVNSSIETKELAREIVKQAYIAGAKKVTVNWSDEISSNYGLEYKTLETLKHIPNWIAEKYREFISEKGCAISIKSPIPDLNKDIDAKKLQTNEIASRTALSFYYDHMMGSKSQWTIVSAPNPTWARKVFPDLEEQEAVSALWEAILKASRVTKDNNPISEWEAHNETILKHNNILNDYNFKALKFKNSLGTDVTVELVKDHIWAGGGELTPEGLLFNPNIPTEENFTMPYKYGVNGKVVATKPLDYQGKLIEDFWLEFKNGKVIDYDAGKNKDLLETLLTFDDGSSYLGEIALISYDSPISNSGILFYNTLFDENASCHMALGRAYTINITDGTSLSLEELMKKGYNHSMAHTDFMFGSKDLNVKGITQDGKEIDVFINGNFVI